MDINEEDKCIIKEVASMGTGHASTALEKMLSSKIGITLPEVDIISLDKIGDLIKEKNLIGVNTKIVGDNGGDMIFVFEEEDARKMTELLNKSTIDSSALTEEIEISTIKEVANILSGAYLTAITNFTDLNLFPDVPNLIKGSKKEIINIVSKKGNMKIIAIKSKLSVEGNIFQTVGTLILSLDNKDITRLLEMIKKRYSPKNCHF